MNLATELPDEDVLLDANRFRRILENLLSNAIQFTDAGGSITLAARRQRASDSGYGRYEFKISDSGVGMSEKFMEHIFDDERGEDVATTEMGGMGLGLSIVKGLVDMMGGSITARSEKDVGTTFTVCLPLKLARHGAGSVEEPPAADCRACGECRALPREDAQSLPIIALSANARDEDRRMSMESGMNSRVAKPFDFARLIETVNEHIGQRESPTV